MKNINEFLSEAEHISMLLTSKYIGKNGLLVKEIDGATGQILQFQSILEEYGDYLQNIAWVGRKTNNFMLVQWVIEQAEIGSSISQAKEGYFLTGISTLALERKFQNLHFTSISDLGDTLVGLVSSYLIVKDEGLKSIIEKFIIFLNSFIRDNGAIDRGFLRYKEIYIRFPLCLPSYCGNFAEEAILLYKHSRKSDYLKLAERIIGFWIANPYFRSVGLFPNKWIVYSQKRPPVIFIELMYRVLKGRSAEFNIAEMAKMNTNLISALLEYYAVSHSNEIREAVYHWFSSVRDKLLTEDGFFYGFWDEARKSRWRGVQPLGQNIPAINILIDTFYTFKDEFFLNQATHCISYWLEKKTFLNLFPEDPLSETEFSRRATLDCQTDLIVVFLKMYCITKDSHYLEAAVNTLEAVLKYYKTPYGLIWSVNSETGEHFCVKVHTKFLGLFIKAPILTYEVLNGNDIFEDNLLYILSRDR